MTNTLYSDCKWDKSHPLNELGNVNELQGILDSLNRRELADIWIAIHACPPPNNLHISFIKRSIVYEWQCGRFGGVGKAILRDIQHHIASNSKTTTKVTIGTSLMQQWRGRTYRVDVGEDGYIYNKVVYKSLSVISKHITGMEYSGYRFFGLKKVINKPKAVV